MRNTEKKMQEKSCRSWLWSGMKNRRESSGCRIQGGKSMNFEQFAKYVEENIKDYLPSRYADANIHILNCRKTTKSESYTGINVALPDRGVNEATPLISWMGFIRKCRKKIYRLEK